jgi:hypothetical protein
MTYWYQDPIIFLVVIVLAFTSIMIIKVFMDATQK